jgi:pheromone shutdown-related protein TraB
MQEYKNLLVVGTSHIARESVEEVQKIIREKKPNIVAVELDRKRLASVLGHAGKRRIRLRDIRTIGIKGVIFNAFGAWVENKLGKIVDIKPGADMKAAIQAAEEVKADVALIDQDIEVTLKRISEELTWREKGRFLKEIMVSLFTKKEKRIEFDLTKVPSEEIIKKLTKKLKKTYPSLYKVLITERNVHMAKSLYKLMHARKEEKIIAIVGAGHEEEIVELIKHESKILGE